MLGIRPLVVYSSADTYFHHVNNIGSRTLMTDYTGNMTQDMVFYPWGYQWLTSGGGGLEFADLAYDDTNLNVDFTANRAMSNNLGRWHSPDPIPGDPSNPQSWNRYGYVANNPATSIDPLGLQNPCPTVGVGAGFACTPEQAAQSNLGGLLGQIYNNPVGVTIPSPFQFFFSFEMGGRWDDPHFYSVLNLYNWAALGLEPTGANNGRNCTVGPATKGQYGAATAHVAAMTGEFFSGLGPGNLTFDPNSATSQVMAQSGPVQEVLNDYYMTGNTNGLYTFGLSGLVASGANPVAQFVGSFSWSITPVNGGINLSLTNTTSFRSLTYDVGPQWQRGSWPTPMGNTHQTYNITAGCQ
jgi:RHS repeat-associated protein